MYQSTVSDTVSYPAHAFIPLGGRRSLSDCLRQRQYNNKLYDERVVCMLVVFDSSNNNNHMLPIFLNMTYSFTL